MAIYLHDTPAGVPAPAFYPSSERKSVAFALIITLSTLLTLLSVPAAAADRFPIHRTDAVSLHLGKVETLRIKDIERVAVGNDDIVSTSLLENDELLIIPQKAGDTEIVIWQTGNRKQLVRIQVRAENPDKLARQVRARLTPFPALKVSVRESLVFVTGQLKSAKDLERIQTLLGKELMQQVVLQLDVDSVAVVRSALKHITTLHVESSDDGIRLTGSYAPEFKNTLETVLQRYPQVINLAQIDLAKMKSMILIDVKILELRKRNLEQLGVRWDSSIAGPSAAIAATGTVNPFFRSAVDSNGAAQIAAAIPVDDTNFHSSVGLLTNVGSRIDLMEEAGEARMLARPMLSARDGAVATFHSGGELPYPIVDPDTGKIAVSFRSYGVKLNVLPQLSYEGKIMVEVNAEVSSIDSSININGVPGLISKSVSSTINAMDGETIVMSGLLANTEAESISKVPLLGDLPLIGALFRTTNTENEGRELAIFLTPRIKFLDYSGEGASSETPITELEKLGERVSEKTADMDWVSRRIQD
ncbi:type II and III secretion system protein family protein [Allohahella sp. A8]|uniref:type II and III secretion system protein family protein n=1 Tax=Allohahella sp. A8 TaxID=3141461 RepID=UPI003A80478A